MSSNEMMLLQQKLNEHIEEFHRHVIEDHDRWDQIVQLQQENAQAIRDLTESTHDIVDAWNAAEGAMRVGVAAGKFVRWLMGLAVIGTAFTWIINHFNHPH